MAQLAVGLAGAAVGSFILPGIGANIGFAIATGAYSYLAADDVESFGPRIEDGNVTTSAYGAMLPKVWGVFPVAGNIIDASPVREVSTTEEESAKGGPTASTTTYTYFSDMDVALHDGEVDAILQIKANGRVIFDASPTAGVVKPDWLNFTFYPGTETQAPDPTMEATHGAGDVPAYRGTAHVVFDDFPHSEFGNSFAINFEFLIAVSASSGTALQATQVMATGEDSENNGGLIEPSTDLLIFPLAKSGQTYAITAVNPLTREIVWQTPPGGISDFDSPTLKPKITTTDTGSIATPGEIAVIAGGEAVNQAIWTIDAISGQVTDISPDKAGTKIFKSLVYDWFDVNPAAQPWYMIDRGAFAGYDFYYGFDTQTEIEPPSGWYFKPEIYSDGEGHILVSLADADISATSWAIAILNTQTLQWTGPTTISDYVSYALWNGENWWVLENNTNTVFKVFDDTATLQATYNWNSLYSISGTPTLNGVGSVFHDDGSNSLFLQNGAALYQWDIDDTSVDPKSYALGPGGAFTLYHSVSGRAWWCPDNEEDAHSANLFAATGSVATLDAVVSDLSIDGTELVAGDIDVTALAVFDVRGMGVSRPTARRNVIQMLQTAYLFDYVPRSGDLTAIVRGQAASATLTEDHIGAHIDGGSPPDPWTIKRREGNALPDVVEVNFVDPDHNYEAATQSARRQASEFGTKTRLSLALALSNDEAAQIADTHLHLQHIESEQYEATTMPSTIDDVQPGEVLTTDYDGVSYTYRAVNASIIDGRMIELTGWREVPEVFTGYAVGGDPRDTNGSVVVLGSTILWPLDIPMLRAVDNNAGVYTAGTSFTTGWPGAEVQRSTDGLSWTHAETLTTQTVMGTATNVPTATQAGFWDSQGTLNIRIIAGTLSSGTRNAPNYAAWGANGRWEIIAFVTKTQAADGSYDITGLARGLRDTWGNVGSHAIGDQFVILDAATLGRITYSASSIDAVEILRGITLGRTSSTAIEVRYTFTAQSMTCFAPERLHGSIDGSSNWDLEWQRQDRVPGRAFWQAAQSETSESYTVEILDDSDTVVRTETTASEAFEYTAAMQTTDWGKAVDLLNWQVSQVSSLTGNGNSRQANIGIEFDYPGTIASDAYIYWRLDETTGTTADDNLDHLDGTYNGTPTFEQTPIIQTGKSVDFDGSSTYIAASTSAESSNWMRSIEMFFNIDSFPGSNYECLLCHETTTASTAEVYVSIGSDSQLHVRMHGVGDALLIDATGATLSTGTDYHVIVNFNYVGTKTINVYLNGSTYGSGSSASTFSLSPAFIRVGYSTERAAHGYFDGRIDEVSFYTSEQDATQRADHFLRGGVA